MKTKNTTTFSIRFQKVTLIAGLIYCIVQIITSLRMLLMAYPGGSGFRISQLTVLSLSLAITPLIFYGLSYFLLTKKGSRLRRAFLAYIAAAIYFSIFLFCSGAFHSFIILMPASISAFIITSPWTLLAPLVVTLLLLAASAPLIKKTLATTALTPSRQKTLALAIIVPMALSIALTLWTTSSQYYATLTLINHLIQTLAPIIFFLVALLINWSRSWQHALLVAAIQGSVAVIIIEALFLASSIGYRLFSVEFIVSTFVQYGIALVLLVALALFLKRA